MLEPAAKPILQFWDAADPFSWWERISELLYAPVWIAVIGVGAENQIPEKKRASGGSDAPVI